jgi:hypothetical protein
MTMEHAERRRWVREIARLNEQAAAGSPRRRGGPP